jgi:calcineurin-like phosphoesterase family protein
VLTPRYFEHPHDELEHLLQKHNALVAADDEVFVIGDAVYDRRYLYYLDFFNGVKTLIRGNHDRQFTDEDLSGYFVNIVEEGRGLEFDFGGIPCYLVHYPSCARKDRFNLVGHVHGVWKFQLNMLNVGVDTNHFAPINADQIPRIFEAINKYCDDDTWAAYLPTNAQYVGVRGKKGRYFK